jgi:hypothetical protein
MGPAERAARASAAAAWVRRFDADGVVDRCLALYTALLARHGSMEFRT